MPTGKKKTSVRRSRPAPRTGFERHVTGASPLIRYVVANHIWLEHLLLSCLKSALPRPGALERHRSLSFPTLVALCEAHDLIQQDLGAVLVRINALRNRFAHRLSFRPDDTEVEGLLVALRDMKDVFFGSYVPASEHEMAIALAAVSGFVEKRARELGVTDVDWPPNTRMQPARGKRKAAARG